jgi:chloride channel 3/4/5
VPAGIYVPSLAIGSCFGRAVGMMMEKWQRSAAVGSYFFAACGHSIESEACITPGVYAVIGCGDVSSRLPRSSPALRAAAVLCGVTRMTVSLVVIMFEITGNLDCSCYHHSVISSSQHPQTCFPS